MNSALGMNVISTMAAVVGSILSYVDLDDLELTPCRDGMSDELLCRIWLVSQYDHTHDHGYLLVYLIYAEN